jgi:SAM-dependent methyltransferase
MMIPRVLQHPLTRGLSVDDPHTTRLRRDIIASKPFLRRIYSDWYAQIAEALADRNIILELGSGAGFFKEVRPHAITSEVMVTTGVDLIADACRLPFADAALDAIVMTDVFHHIPDVELFLSEATRTLHAGGRLVMVEPWRTRWSEWIYTNLHPEPFLVDGTWEIPRSGPLSGANGALPWIVFGRDLARFAERFPQWRILKITPMMPIAYLLSGGVSLRSLMPGCLYAAVRFVERLFGEHQRAMFALIVLERSA